MARTLAGYATQVDPVDDIVCAYTTSPTQLPVDPNQIFVVIGEFSVPTAVNCRLEVLGFVSAADLTLEVAIYNPEPMAESLTTLTSQAVTKVRSLQRLDLVPGVVYQIVARCLGTEDPNNFAVVRHASIGAP